MFQFRLDLFVFAAERGDFVDVLVDAGQRQLVAQPVQALFQLAHLPLGGGEALLHVAQGALVAWKIDDALLANVRANGAGLLAGLARLAHVVDASGAGYLVGAELSVPAQPFVDAALDAGLVCLTSGPNVLRLAPPLVAETADIDRALEILAEVMSR